MKLVLLALLAGGIGWGQVTNWAAAGLSYNPGASPAIAGTGLYARQLTGTTYAFTVVDALPTSWKPFTVNTQIATGVAQRIFSVRGVDVFVPGAAGIVYNGNNVGWGWTTGGLVSVLVRANSSWRIFPNLRVAKSSVGSGYQVFGGVLVGWGW